jgi:GNAT superfamily N-acetyltransferase
MESVRPAIRSDADTCASLSQKALGELSGIRGGSLFSRRETGLLAKAFLRPGGLDRLISDPRRLVLLGLIDDTAVGLAVARAENVGEAPFGVLDACYVEPEARGVGVGRMMLDASISWLEIKGCKALDAAALPGQRESKAFYEAAGFKARLITMHRELP